MKTKTFARTTIVGILLILCLMFGFFYQKHHRINAEPISKTAFKLNTIVTITIYDSKDEHLLDEAIALCDTYEELFSRTKKSSEIYQLNHRTLKQTEDSYLLSAETAELISKGLKYGELSDGAFDITIEPISSLWDFTSEEKQLPRPEQIEQALPLINYKNITLSENKLNFEQNEMKLDLGAIAKGYIADKIKEFLVSKNVTSAVINLGGNVLCIGSRPDGTPFNIGIQKPFAERSETIAVVDIADKSIVSSGIYERFFEKDGTLYHHILNPDTGYPYHNNLVSVTIISEKSVDGDGLSTSCFALGLEKGLELIDTLPNTEAVFITADNQLHYSKNFKQNLSKQQPSH